MTTTSDRKSHSSQEALLVSAGPVAIPSQWFPLWQMPLPEGCQLQEMTLEGWGGDQDHPPVLTVLVSDDGENWLPVGCQVYHELENSQDIRLTFSNAPTAHYVRLRYECDGPLVFEKVAFRGVRAVNAEAISAAEKIAQYQEEARNSQIVLGTLFNESDDYLISYINNFLAYSPENVTLLINFPSDRSLPPYPVHPRVHVFNGEIKREKWGITLLLGYLEIFGRAQEVVPDFTHFASMASNGLLVRPMDLPAILMQLALKLPMPASGERSYERDTNVEVCSPTWHGTWMWYHFRNSEGLGKYVAEEMALEKASISQIEGLFARRADWNVLYERWDQFVNLAPYTNFENFLALEELFPVSMMQAFGSGVFTHICQVLWRSVRVVTVDDLVVMAPRLPNQLCSLKWFDRSPKAQSTLAVTTDWGRQLLALGKKPADPEVLQKNGFARYQEIGLAERLVKAARQEERFGPLSDRWWKTEEQARRGGRWFFETLPCDRQIHELPLPDSAPLPRHPVRLFMEHTNATLSLLIELRENEQNETVLRMVCTAQNDEGPISGVHLMAYLYVSGLQGDTVFKLTLPQGGCQPPDVLGRVVMFNEFDYFPTQADEVEKTPEGECLTYARAAVGPEGQIWMGLPVCSNSEVEVKLTMGPYFQTSRADLLKREVEGGI